MGSRRGLSPITKQFSAYLAFAIVNLDPKKVPIKLIRRKKVEVNFFYERGERRDLGPGWSRGPSVLLQYSPVGGDTPASPATPAERQTSGQSNLR